MNPLGSGGSLDKSSMLAALAGGNIKLLFADDPEMLRYLESQEQAVTMAGGNGGSGIAPKPQIFDIEVCTPRKVTDHSELQIGDVAACEKGWFGGGFATYTGRHAFNGGLMFLRHDGDRDFGGSGGPNGEWSIDPHRANELTIIGVDKNEMAKRKPQKKVELKFDLKQLDAVIIAKEVRDEIEAVLKQHKNAAKLFDEWGLGDVIEYGRGMTFMFYGPPGTGKTWMATCIARAVGKEVIKLSAADIQTSEPGGANRNIQQAFKTAKDSKKVLFLDECDSIITSRNDVCMILGSEINTLLTEIEQFEGIVILATNRIETLDEALERRISLIVEFPEPDFGQREKIWEKLLPKKMPLAKNVSVKKLSEFKLTGGQIKNAVLQAARLALSAEAKEVTLEHFTSAIERIQKSKSLMGNASRYKQIRVQEDFRKGNA